MVVDSLTMRFPGISCLAIWIRNCGGPLLVLYWSLLTLKIPGAKGCQCRLKGPNMEHTDGQDWRLMIFRCFDWQVWSCIVSMAPLWFRSAWLNMPSLLGMALLCSFTLDLWMELRGLGSHTSWTQNKMFHNDKIFYIITMVEKSTRHHTMKSQHWQLCTPFLWLVQIRADLCRNHELNTLLH